MSTPSRTRTASEPVANVWSLIHRRSTSPKGRWAYFRMRLLGVHMNAYGDRYRCAILWPGSLLRVICETLHSSVVTRDSLECVDMDSMTNVQSAPQDAHCIGSVCPLSHQSLPHATRHHLSCDDTTHARWWTRWSNPRSNPLCRQSPHALLQRARVGATQIV